MRDRVFGRGVAALAVLVFALMAFGPVPAINALLVPQAKAQSFLDGEFDPAIPTLTQTIGHAPADRITSTDETITYLQALAKAAPQRMKMVEYARSWQGRPLYYIIITAPENMARLDAVQADLSSIAAGRPGNGSALPVTWLTYGVHGNEISSTDAAMMMAYHLLAAKNDTRAQKILRETIVVLDPMQNPDGRARFVQNFRGSLGIEPTGDRQAAEHDEPWPSGRVNHYLFDLNRDWFTLSQPETRGKVKAIRQWNPVVVVDVHEMGGDNSYFFSPAAQPINPNITASQRRAYELIGRNNASWFDRIGQPYFTREVYDLFYPGYGDTWNTHQGAIGSTYEQASSRGLLWDRRDGKQLTYADTVRNHFIASFSTAEAVSNEAARFLTDYADYRAANANGAAGRGSYIIDLATRRWNAEALGRRLVAQGIEVVRRDGAATACGTSYPNGYLAVTQAQPAARLVRSLLDRNTALPPDFVNEQERRRTQDLPHELYDVTAWSVGLMSGVDVRLCNGAVSGQDFDSDAPITPIAQGEGGFAVAVPWTDSGQARLVMMALREGLEAKVTDEAFTKDGRSYPRGTVLFPVKDNSDEGMQKLAAMARDIGAETIALGNSWVEDGPNLGSTAFARLTQPKVAMAWGDGISQLSAGSMRYVLERRLGQPVVPIRTDRLARADLDDYDVLIVPEGSPDNILGDSGQRTISNFVRRGGILVAVGDSIASFAEGDDALLAVKREAALGREPANAGEDDAPLAEAAEITSDEEYRAAIEDPLALPDRLPGALLNTVADPNHFLSAGYDGGATVLATGSLIYTPLDRSNGINVMRFAAADKLVASGYVWGENIRQLAFKPYMMAQRSGEGMTIGFAHDPSTRAYLDGLDLLLANAVIIAPSRVR